MAQLRRLARAGLLAWLVLAAGLLSVPTSASPPSEELAATITGFEVPTHTEATAPPSESPAPPSSPVEPPPAPGPTATDTPAATASPTETPTTPAATLTATPTPETVVGAAEAEAPAFNPGAVP